MADLWPPQYFNAGGNYRTIDGVPFAIELWKQTGPYPKTKVAFEGTYVEADGFEHEIALTYYLDPKGHAVDFELVVDGHEHLCHRITQYRDGGTQIFRTRLGELFIPAPRKIERGDRITLGDAKIKVAA
jgi:hypothetical protein